MFRFAFVFGLLTFSVVLMASPLQAGDWPMWRGADRTDVSQETGLLKAWPEGGPKQLWANPSVGVGYSSFAIVGGKLYTLGAREETEFLICLDANSGKELWATPIGPRLDNNQGDGPRGTPAVGQGIVCAMGGLGTVVCANAETGEVKWQKELTSLGGKKPGWGFSESVLIDGDRVVCTPGGDQGSIAVFNAADGEIVWRSTGLIERAGYSSVVPVELNGQKQYVQLFPSSVAGVSAADGKLLWKSEWPGKTAVIPTPIIRDGHVFITSGYGVGCKLVKVGSDDKTEDVYFNKNMKNHHGGVVLVGDHLYGYSDQVGWTCLDFKTGAIVWAEKSELGKGCVTTADGMLYCQDERDGTVVLAAASPEGWKESGRFKLPSATEESPPESDKPAKSSRRRGDKGKVWTHPVISNGRLFLRNQEMLSCFDVKAQ